MARTPARLALVVVLAAGVVRLLVAAFTPLFPDEAYYWVWSRHLAAGYFDHPPAIAWLIRAGTAVAGHTPLGVRLGPVLAGVVAAGFLSLAARRMAGDRAALVVAMVFAVMPLSAAGLILATPDAPLLAAASIVVYALARALAAAPRSPASLRWWCVAGVALGAAFASKLTAALLPLGVLLGLLTNRAGRARLREPGPYVASALAVLVFLPVIAWNARHGWIAFTFQLRHGLGPAPGSVLSRELELLGGQVGLVSPILFALGVVALTRALRSASPEFDAVSLETRGAFAGAAVAIAAFFVYSATRRRVEANWPAPAYMTAVPLLAAYHGGRTWRRWLGIGLGLAAALTLVTYVNAFTPILPVPARRDPAARAWGWDVLAREVHRVYGPRLSLSSRRTFVAADRYQDASVLAFHLPEHPETFSLNLTGRPNQYDLWPRFRDRARPGDAMILVLDEVDGSHPTVAALEPHFSFTARGALVPIARAGSVVKNMRIWILDGWRGTWPGAPLRSRS